MMNKTVVYFSVIYTSVTILPLLLSYLMKRKYKKLCEKSETDSEQSYYYQSLFFCFKNFACKPHVFNNEEHDEQCSLTHMNRILRFISSAQSSISLCCYTITCRSIGFELIKAHKRGVTVRIITDNVMMKSSGSTVDYCQKFGIPYKTQSNKDRMMHHKFCLVDEKDPEKAKMFFGTSNLTLQAFCKNFEAVIMTNDRTTIKRFSEEFEELWGIFS